MKKLVEKKDDKIEDVMSIIVDIYFYFYFVTSILSLIFYFTGSGKLFEIMSIIIIVGVVIDFLLGYTRSLFGTLGIIIFSIIGVVILKDIKTGIFLGITICMFISSLVNVIINKIINIFYRLFG